MAKIQKIEMTTKCFGSYFDIFSVVRLYFNFIELNSCVYACYPQKYDTNGKTKYLL